MQKNVGKTFFYYSSSVAGWDLHVSNAITNTSLSNAEVNSPPYFELSIF
jgi:hypothetical protein